MNLVLALALIIGVANSSTVARVRLVDHVPYMVNVLQEVFSEVERREWCNLKVPDLTISIFNETVIDRFIEGTVTYSNGFLSSMHQVDILQEGVDQIWSWNNTDSTGSVLVRGTVRMHHVTLGYDVVADLADGHHRYTVTVTYPLVRFLFTSIKNVHTDVFTTTVVGTITTSASINTIKFLPTDNTTDVLTTLFNVALPEDGIKAWAEVLEPILHHVVTDVVEFPTICYDCPT